MGTRPRATRVAACIAAIATMLMLPIGCCTADERARAAEEALAEVANRRRSIYVERSTGRSEEVRTAILEGRVILGMSTLDLEASVGPPITIVTCTSMSVWLE
ncbi:MAG: hypothetical protein R3F20_09040 [Planctomycetota bacterium]